MIKRIYYSAFVKVVRREIQRFVKTPALIFLMLIAPVISYLLIMWMFSDGVIRNVPIAVVDNDNTQLSRNIVRQINATSAVSIVSDDISVSMAKDNMDQGKVDAIIVIPESTEQNIIKGKSSELAVYLNNTNVVKGGVVKSGIYKTLSTISTGIKVQMYQKTGYTQHQAIDKAYPVKLNTHMLFNPYTNYSYFLTLGLLPLMAIVFIFLGSLYALGLELKEGTANDLYTTAENSVVVAIVGKLLPYTFLLFVNIMLMNYIQFSVLRTPIKGSLAIIILSELLLILSYQVIAVLFLNITANMRLSLSLGSAYTMMALTFSGLTFPAMGMPLIAKLFSWIFPYTFWLKIFLSQSLRGEPVYEILSQLIILLIFILLGALSFKGMKIKLTNSKYWGKE